MSSIGEIIVKMFICMLIGAAVTYIALTRFGVDGIAVVDAFIQELKDMIC